MAPRETCGERGPAFAVVVDAELVSKPRLFYLHFWAVDDGVTPAKALRTAVDAHHVHPRELTSATRQAKLSR
ncbi:DUF1259 domain-containing protein [Lentzea sp. NPDC004782]|uniref:DUF1259 domain-containing protein n=1 Tax=Lentzea sp. NPDC004782 TaxID=3154458 RepID=UPI0033A4A4B4